MSSNKSTDIIPFYTFTPTVDGDSIVSHSSDQSVILLIQNISRSEFDISSAGFVELGGITNLKACQLEGSDFKYPIYKFKIHADGVILLRSTEGRDTIGIRVSAKTSEHVFQIGLAYDVNATESAHNVRDSFVGPNPWRSGQEYQAQTPLTDAFYRSTANIEAYASTIPDVISTVGIQLRDKDSVSLFGPLEYPCLEASTFSSTYTIYNDSDEDFYCVLEERDMAEKPWLIFGYSAVVGLAGLLPFGTTWSTLAFGWGTVVSLLATLDPGRPDANTFARFLPRGSYIQKRGTYAQFRLIKNTVSPNGTLTTYQTGTFTDIGAPTINKLTDPKKNWLKTENFKPFGFPILLQKQTRGLETLVAFKLRNMKPLGGGKVERDFNVFTFIEDWAMNDLLLYQETIGGRDREKYFLSFNPNDFTFNGFDGSTDGYTIFLLTTTVRPGKPKILYRQDGRMGLLLENYEITGGKHEHDDTRTSHELDAFVKYFTNPNLPRRGETAVSVPPDIPKNIYHSETSSGKHVYSVWSMGSGAKIRPSFRSSIIIGLDHSATFIGKGGAEKDNSLLAVQKLL